ncbi:MAG: hypothetical protein A4E57_04411 [Syntrophorhabdaceae bacterium PtaU1.Bin034]|nr:MAG: hypothetical protein A4E57_04411 [Syntrophorhabdaceae bacterium PtaU1.Bin034]
MEYILLNDRLRIAVRPDLGGRIDQITDLETGKEWLWHPAWYKGGPRRLEVGASFDENWSGGWDEVFPNDAACMFMGRSLPDHGELWSQPWHVVTASKTAMVVSYSCSTVPVSVEKGVFVEEEGIKIRYLLENSSDEQLPFLFKLHPALQIEPGDEIVLPECEIEPVDTGFSTVIGMPGKTRFPVALDKNGKEVRVNHIPGRDADEQEFFYATNVSEPWCGIRSARTGKIFLMRFDGEQIPYVWVFGSYGKWRKHYVLVLEPCTNVPYDLAAAHGNGTCALLGPGERREMIIDISLEKITVPSVYNCPAIPVTRKGNVQVAKRQ